MAASKHAAWAACILLLAGHLSSVTGAPTLRHLLQDEETPTADPIFKTGTNIVATETPSFKVKSNPTPAGYTTNTNVRSERPYLTVKNTVPPSVVTSSSDTKVQTWDSATYKFTNDVNGIKSAFDTGKRVFEVNTGNQATANFPSYEVAGGGGTPFTYKTSTEITGSTPNTAINIASGAGPNGSGGYALSLGPANLGRRLRGMLRNRRQLLQDEETPTADPIFKTGTNIVATETPSFKVKSNPTPAGYTTNTNVRSERPYLTVKNTVPPSVVTSSSDTKVQTWDSATYKFTNDVNGIKSAFDTGKRVFEVNTGNQATANFPSYEVAGGGGTPFTFNTATEITGSTPNTAINIASGAGPSGSGGYALSLGPANLGRRLRGMLRNRRQLLQDEETPTADPIFKTGTNIVATETPSFKVKSNPTPAGYTTNTNVRSERPYLTVKNTVPPSVVTSSSDTKVQTWDSATYKFTNDVNGIKSAFDTGKRVFEVNTGNQATANFPSYEVAGGGGTPFTFNTATEITGSTPNTAINIASGAGPSGSGGYALSLGPANLGRRLRGMLRNRRQLLQDEETPTADPIFKTGTNIVATETPSFKVKSNPTPAGYTTNTNVRSERPYLTVKNTVPPSVVTSSSDTKVQTWDSATYKFTNDVNGIKSAFDTGKRVFEVNTGNQATVNFPSYEVAGGGGTPFTFNTATEITGSTPNTAINIASGAGPSGSGGYALSLGPANLGRRLRGMLRNRRQLLQDEETPTADPIFKTGTNIVATETPSFKVKSNPTPAGYTTNTNVRSERPYLTVKNTVPPSVVTSSSDTKVQTWDSATYKFTNDVNGIKSAFDTGKRVFEVNTGNQATANFPSYEVAGGGGTPFTFNTATEITGSTPNTAINIASGAGPSGSGGYALSLGPANLGRKK